MPHRLSRYPLFQQAYVVNDLDEGARRWSALAGAGPFFMTRHHATDRFRYRGEPVEADVSYAFGYLGDLMIQLIEQHDDSPSIYRDMFPAGTEGFHHIAFLVPAAEFATERQRIIDLGCEAACDLEAGGVHACYLDAREQLGVFVELHDDPPRIPAVFGEWREAHRTWDGVDPIIERSDGRPPR